jgi:arylsulfatase
MIRWPGIIRPGQILNGIQAHMDMFTTFAAIAGVPEVAEQMKKEKHQYIDGVNNLDYWLGKSKESKRNDFMYYYESKLMAVRQGPWKIHFTTREDYYGALEPRGYLIFNIHSDPFESYDSKDSYGHMAQRVSWLVAPMMELVQQHLKTIIEYPPVQKGTSFDASNMVQEVMDALRSNSAQ